MSVFIFLCGSIGLTVNGDVTVVLFCYARCFCCCCCQYCTFEWYCWRLYVLWLGLLFVRLPIVFMCFCRSVFCCLSRLDLRLTHWSIDWLIDWSIDWLLGDWLFGFVRSFFLFRALCPWALWPLRVSVGPSWFCRADFSNGTVQKLSAISTQTTHMWLKTTPSGTMGEIAD